MEDWKIFKEGDAEEWRPCPGFELMYDISSEGNVRSYHVGDGKVDRASVPKFRKPSFSPKYAYWNITLSIRNKQFTRTLHVLVAKAFIHNPDPHRLRYVNHRNAKKEMVAAWNLEWCTAGENQRHAYGLGLRERPDGSRNGRCKLQEFEVLEIFNSTQNHYKLASQYNVSRRVVAGIKSGELWGFLTGMVYVPRPKRDKLTDEQILDVFTRSGTIKQICQATGISRGIVESIKSGRHYSAITGKEFKGKREYTYYGITAKVTS